MAARLQDIEWGEPLLPVVPDPAWEVEVRRRGGQVTKADRMIAPCPWLREASFGITHYRPRAMPARLFQLGALITSQENACRYCYGANRAFMKILGFSETVIQRIEHDLHVAELDDQERGFVAFCRSLARSRPRPTRAARDAMVAMGYSRLAVDEMAFAISMGCFFNRVTTFMACPPENDLERIGNGPIGRVLGWMAPMRRMVSKLRRPAARDDAPGADMLAGGLFGPILVPLAGLPAARVMRDALDGAFAPSAISHGTKSLVFAIVARTLGCGHCEAEARSLLQANGMSETRIDQALATLRCDGLSGAETPILPWARGTVHYDTGEVQRATRAMAGAVGNTVVLEAIGIAALANAVVRLAMLQE